MAKIITPQMVRKKVKQLTKRFRELEQDKSVKVSIENRYGTNYELWNVLVFNSKEVVAATSLWNSRTLHEAIQQLWEDYNQRKKKV